MTSQHLTDRVLVICGPTASGKSALASELAKTLPVEIVNADALQCFRHMTIGTAKPSHEDRAGIPHHLFDILDPDQPLTVASYAQQAQICIKDILARGKLPCLVGGAGFYLQAVFFPPHEEAPSTGPQQTLSVEEAWQLIQSQDPETSQKLHPNDHYRILRAAKLIQKGLLPSQHFKAPAQSGPAFASHWLGLDWPRQVLYTRINHRVTDMFAQGLVDETAQIRERFPSALPRLEKSIGYQEALALLDKRLTLPEAINLTQQRTRHYAKRQMTWFRRHPEIRWIDCSKTDFEIAKALEHVW